MVMLLFLYYNHYKFSLVELLEIIKLLFYDLIEFGMKQKETGNLYKNLNQAGLAGFFENWLE